VPCGLSEATETPTNPNTRKSARMERRAALSELAACNKGR